MSGNRDKATQAIASLRASFRGDTAGLRMLDDISKYAAHERKQRQELAERAASQEQSLAACRERCNSYEATVAKLKAELSHARDVADQSQHEAKAAMARLQSTLEAMERARPELDEEVLQSLSRDGVAFKKLWKRLHAVMPVAPPLRSELKPDKYWTVDLADLAQSLDRGSCERIGTFVAFMASMGVGVTVAQGAIPHGATLPNDRLFDRILRWMDVWIETPKLGRSLMSWQSIAYEHRGKQRRERRNAQKQEQPKASGTEGLILQGTGPK